MNHRSTTKRPFIKVCGHTHASALDCSTAFGVDYVGFCFAAGAAHYVSVKQAAAMRSAQSLRVGVFAEDSADDIEQVMAAARLDMVQVDAMRSPALGLQLGATNVICSLVCRVGDSVAELQQRIDAWRGCCGMFRLEVAAPTVDVSALRFPHPWMLAGRITAHNVGTLLRKYEPDGVELFKGEELSPGLKDTSAMLEFVKSVYSA